MEEFTKDLEKLIKAGIGAVSEGLSKSAKMIDSLAEKGEPLYQQAADAVSQTAGKVKDAVRNTWNNNDMKAVRASIEKLSREQLAQAAQWIDELLKKADEPAKEDAPENENAATPEEAQANCEDDSDAPLDQACCEPKEEPKAEDTEE